MEALAGIEADIESYFGEQDQQKSSSDGCKQVPWLSWEEWDSVRESLFSSSPDRIASALERVILCLMCYLSICYRNRIKLAALDQRA